MKIKCEYCGSVLDDAVETCPNCGAVYSRIKPNQAPQTIEELKQWYEDRHLPPSDVTRFFIGKDVIQAKAFGIFQDKQGNFIVYKNKASGERAIRYKGTDEAYAVNELYLKLKEIIVLQKSNNHNTNKEEVRETSSSGTYVYTTSEKIKDIAVDVLLFIPRLLWKILKGIWKVITFLWNIPFVGPVLSIASGTVFVSIIVIIILMAVQPYYHGGYFQYEGVPYYYHSDTPSYGMEWFRYDDNTQEWQWLSDSNANPLLSIKPKKANRNNLGSDWKDSFGFPSFQESTWGKDCAVGFDMGEGYYLYDESCFFHISGGFNGNWYVYDTAWQEKSWDTLPEALQHPSLAVEFAHTDASYLPPNEIPDFRQTVTYQDYAQNYAVERGYYVYDNRNYYHLNGDVYDGWYYYNDDGDEWETIDYEALPEDLRHSSLTSDFFYTPDWDTETQFSDFEDTDFYSDYERSTRSHDGGYDGDDDYDWGGGDTWDNDVVDWDTDW